VRRSIPAGVLAWLNDAEGPVAQSLAGSIMLGRCSRMPDLVICLQLEGKESGSLWFASGLRSETEIPLGGGVQVCVLASICRWKERGHPIHDLVGDALADVS
jgi:hypothetical protein